MSALGAAKSLAKGALTQLEVAGEVAGEVTKSAGNLAKTTGKIAENAGKIAEQITANLSESTGKITDNAGKIATKTSEAGIEAAKALTSVVSVAKNLTSAADSLAQRANDSINRANERRAIIEKEKNELLLRTSSIKTDTKVTEETKRLEQQKQEIIKNAELRKQEIDNELLVETKRNEIERKKIEAEAQKLKKEFENAQLIQAQTQQVTEINTYIGTRFGYKDSDCIEQGYNLSSSLFNSNKKYFFYMVTGIMDANGNYLQVKFNKEDGKDGYFVIKDGYIYKLAIIANIVSRTSLMSRKKYFKKLPSYANIIHVKYTPICFANDVSVNWNNGISDPIKDETKYSIMTELKEFTIKSHVGGNKTRKNKIRNKKQKNKKTKRTKKT
jgi:hypothetical protein